MDRDGTGIGFDCELHAPDLASRANSGDRFRRRWRRGTFCRSFSRRPADAALAASIFHFGLSSISDLKQQLIAAGIPVRFPC